MGLSAPRQQHHTGGDQTYTRPLSQIELFAQQGHAQYRHNYHAEFVHGRDEGCLAQLQRAVIAEPGSSRGQAGQH